MTEPLRNRVSSDSSPVAAITGATGYLGSILESALSDSGFSVRRLVRSPPAGTNDCRLLLGSPVGPDALDGVDVLVHCAYEMTLTNRAEIWQRNVFGAIELFDAALDAGVRRTIAVSSMSTYPGTRQLYGRAKLETESSALVRGMTVVRPGLVYDPGWGGMAGTLRRLSTLPLLPDFGADARQFTVHEDDFAQAIVALSQADVVPGVPVSLAHPDPLPFRELIGALAESQGKATPRFIEVPAMAAFTTLRAAELPKLPLPVRADSLLGLVRPAPTAGHVDVIADLGVVLRPFAGDEASLQWTSNQTGGAVDRRGRSDLRWYRSPVTDGSADLAGDRTP